MKFLPTNFKTTCNAHLGQYSLAKGEQLRNNSVVFIPMREEEKVFIFQFLVIIQLYKVDNVAVFTDSNIFLRVCELLSIYKKNISRNLSRFVQGKNKRCFVQGKLCFLSQLESFSFFDCQSSKVWKKVKRKKERSAFDRCRVTFGCKWLCTNHSTL